MGTFRSKEDDVQQISTSVFVTNFPDQFSAKDLWNTCKQYGSVVDAFIPNRKSKAGKRFGFGRFIKTFDVDRLVNNLCSNNIDLKYMGGYWVMIKFQSKEAKKTFQSNAGIGTWTGISTQKEFASTRILHLIFLSRLKSFIMVNCFGFELKRFLAEPEFMEDNDDDSSNDDVLINDLKKDEELEVDSDTEAVPDTIFDNDPIHSNAVSVEKQKTHSEDPFNIYKLLTKNKENNHKESNLEDSLKIL
nr:UvrD-like helicase, ATP-binding domain, P-loop containing nucleoside triphosphate hydrolase [Tanacetum cinerariifolium]